MAAGAQGLAPRIGRLGEGRVGVAAHGVEGERAVGARRFEQQALVLLRDAPVGHRRQRLDLDLDRLQRVLADRDAVGDHHRHRLADIAHLVMRR